ncbi:flagellar brake protein [Salibacterium sp. K-3]
MINIGDTIHLELEEVRTSSNRKKLDIKTYRCKLMDHEDGVFIVDPPINEETGRTGFFMEGVELHAWFVGRDEALYTFETEVKGKGREKVRSLQLTDPGKDQYVRIQRRNYVRINTAVDTAVYPHKHGAAPFITSTIDISGGGMSVLLPDGHGLFPQDSIKTWVVLHMMDGIIHYLQMNCTVVRIIEGNGAAKERCSLRFEEMDEADRQLIIKFCFDQQLEVRKYRKSRNH